MPRPRDQVSYSPGGAAKTKEAIVYVESKIIDP
jgi:hypothetical protein